MKLRVTRLRVLVPIDVYRKDVLFLFGYSHQQAATLLETVATFDTTDIRNWLLKNPDNYQGMTFAGSCGDGLIMMPFLPETPRDYATLAHEIFHAVEWIMNYVENPLMPAGNSESWAYLISYITDRLYTTLNQYLYAQNL